MVIFCRKSLAFSHLSFLLGSIRFRRTINNIVKTRSSNLQNLALVELVVVVVA